MKTAADFQNFLEDTTIYWDYVDDKLMEMVHCDTRIKFYLPDTPQGHETLAQIQTDLARLQQDCDINLGELTVEIGYKEQEEWETAWQKYYHPIEISDRLVIVPDWERLNLRKVRNSSVSIRYGLWYRRSQYDPSVFTGAGQPDAGRRIGPGYGLWQWYSVDCGTDAGCKTRHSRGYRPAGDQNCAGKRGAEPYSEEQLEIICGNVLNDPALGNRLAANPVDLIVANIVADVIIGMAPLFLRCLKKGGQLIVSGIISERAEEVLGVLRDTGFTVTGQQEDGGWCAASLRG